MYPNLKPHCNPLLMPIGGRFIAFFAVLVPIGVFGCGAGTSTFSGLSGDAVIEGRVRDSSGFGIPGVVVAASGVREAGVTDPAGRYQVTVPGGWSGTIRPQKQNFAFAPAVQDASAAALEGVDFTASIRSTPTTFGGQQADLCGDPNFDNGNTASELVIDAPQVVPLASGGSTAEVRLDGSGSRLPEGSRVEWRRGGVPIAFELTATLDLPVGRHELELISIQPNGTERSGSVIVNVITEGPQSIYVDANHPSANDANSGTQDTPLATIQAGVDRARAGDVVIVRSGTYYRNHPSVNRPVVTMENRHGTAEQPITITADVGATPRVTGMRPGAERGNTGWRIVDSSWIVINGFRFEDLNGVGLDIEASSPGATHHIDVLECIAERCSQGPNTFVGALRAVGPVRYVNFKNCMISNSSSGIVLREAPVQTRETAAVPPKAGNNAPGSPGGAYTADMPEAQWADWCGWDQIAPKHCVIENCLSFGNRQVPEHSDGFGTRYATHCIIKDNIAFGNADDNFDLLGGTHLTVTGNIAFNGNPENTDAGDGNGIKVGVRGGLDCLVAYNISFDNRRMGLDMGDTERGRVFHNTIVNNGTGHPNGFGMWFEGGRSTAGHQVMFNILQGNGLDTSRGDYGAARHVSFAASDYNSMSDSHNHNFAGPSGSEDRVGDNVDFPSWGAVASPGFTEGMSITQRMNALRQRVRDRFRLPAGSPLHGTATVVTGVNDDVTTPGGNWGAVQE